jgi:hypothetical protein
MTKRIAVITNDAGGAEVVSALIKREIDNYVWHAYMFKGSPAHKVFKRKGLDDLAVFRDSRDFDDLLCSKYDYFFSTTSWALPEHRLVKIAKQKGIPTAVFLDHWNLYKQRFGFPEKGWQKYLPDFIVSGDKESYRIASDLGLPGIVKLNNYYFLDMLEDYQHLPAKNRSRSLLFISQAIKGNTDPYTKFEKSSLDLIMNNFEFLARLFDLDSIRIRMHPAQKASDYNGHNRSKKLNVVIEDPNQTPLIASIAESGLVLGIDSMALFIAHLVGALAVSFIPAKVKPIIPIPKIFCVHKIADFNKVYALYRKKQTTFRLFETYPLRKLIKKMDAHKMN